MATVQQLADFTPHHLVKETGKQKIFLCKILVRLLMSFILRMGLSVGKSALICPLLHKCLKVSMKTYSKSNWKL